MKPAPPLAGRFWRIVSPRWISDPLSGAGAARHGGRWNRPGQSALYLSVEVETAFAEYQQEIGTRPGTFIAYDVAGARVLDLTYASTRDGLDVSQSSMLNPWKQIAFVEGGEPPTWRHATRLSADADGVLVPSTMRAGGVNLVLWRWNEGPVQVRFHDPKGDLDLVRK